MPPEPSRFAAGLWLANSLSTEAMPRTSSRSGRRPLTWAPTSSKLSPAVCGDSEIPIVGRPGSSVILNRSVATSSTILTRLLVPNNCTSGSPAKICHAEPLGQPADANRTNPPSGTFLKIASEESINSFVDRLDCTIRRIVLVANSAKTIPKPIQRDCRLIAFGQEDTVDQADRARMNELKRKADRQRDGDVQPNLELVARESFRYQQVEQSECREARAQEQTIDERTVSDEARCLTLGDV